MTDTVAAVTAAREALAEQQRWMDSHKHHHSARRTDVKRLSAALRDLLAVVDRLTAPPSEDEIEAGLKAWFEHVPGANYNLTAEHVKERNRSRMKAALAASGRRHLPTETKWEWGALNAQGVMRASGSEGHVRRMVASTQFPECVQVAHRRPAGPWEVPDEQ